MSDLAVLIIITGMLTAIVAVLNRSNHQLRVTVHNLKQDVEPATHRPQIRTALGIVDIECDCCDRRHHIVASAMTITAPSMDIVWRCPATGERQLNDDLPIVDLACLGAAVSMPTPDTTADIEGT